MEIKEKHPDARVYFMTGYSAEDLIQKAVNGGALGVFSKPVDLGKVLATLGSEAA
jgi:ActR/RegA family two-component response regulator